MNRFPKRLIPGVVLLALAACAWLGLRSVTGPGPSRTGGGAAGLEMRAADRPGPEAAGASGANAAGQPSSIMPPARRPAGVWLTKIPQVGDYLEKIPPAMRAIHADFSAAFPQFDPTDRNQFAEAVLARRATYPDVLGERDSLDFNRWLVPMEEMQKALVAARAGHIGIPVNTVEAGDKYFTLVGFDGVNPLYLTTCNVNAATSTAASHVRLNAAFDPALAVPASGDGHYVNINDHGTIYEHAEFQLPESRGSRIVLAEVNDAGNRSHMTHVAGTVAAWGYNSNLMGMAPRIWIRSFIQQADSDITGYGMQFPGQKHGTPNPRTGEPEMKSIIGTTSLGYDLTSHNDCIYTSTCASFDSVLRDYPYYSHFFAASNNGSNYLTLGNEWPMCKNLFTIGSVSDVSRDSNGNDVSGGIINSFSARGPTFDGRIKPDLTANGDGVTSTDGTSGTSVKSGTSMATPNASGTAALLVDYIFKKLPGHHFRSSTLKALLVNTATDRGNSGPDYQYGWGIINVKAAAGIVKRYGGTPASRVVLEDELMPNETWTATYQYDGSGPIRATLAWIDPPGGGQATGTTDRSPRLVNNLNLRLVAGDGTVYQPYVMPFTLGSGGTPAFDASLYSAAATTGDNVTDNVEQVHVANPPAGTYTLRIEHGGSLLNGSPQNFSLAVTGMAQTAPVAPVIGSVSPALGNATDNFALTIDGTGFLLGSDVILRRAGSADVTAYGVMPVDDRILCRIDSAAMAKGYWDVVVRAPDGTESVLTNGFLMPVAGGARVSLYTNDFEDGPSGLTLGAGWSLAAPAKESVGGPATAQQGSSALVTHAGGNYPNNVITYATLPPVRTIGLGTIQLEIQRWLGVKRQGSSTDRARVQYSLNGTNWTNVTSHSNLIESAWSRQTYTLPAAAGGQPAVYLRFALETDSANVSFGWCIDDLNVTGIASILYPPVFTSGTPAAGATVGRAFQHAITVIDEDTAGPGLLLAASGLPPGLSFQNHDNGSGTIAGTPSEAGTSTITLSVTDGAYTTYQIFDLHVLPKPNSAPVITTGFLPAATVGTAYSATIQAGDEDGDVPVLGIGGLPAWLGFTDHGDGSATLAGTPPPGSAGSFELTITASDGELASQANLVLPVNPPQNTAANISPIPDQNIPANGTTGLLAFTIGDSETDAVLLEVTGTSSNQELVPDASLIAGGEGAERTLIVTPAPNRAGTAVITLTVSDGELASQIHFTLTVRPTFESWIHAEAGVEGLTGGNDDPDRDGIVNLMEYALAGHAGVADTGILPTGRIAVVGESSHLEIVITKNRAATGIRYTVEVGSDLVNWHSGEEHTTVVEETDESLIVRDKTPVTGNPGQRFIRLKVARE